MMARHVVLQPDGKYAVWSTISDNFLLLDATREEVIQEYMADAVYNATRRAESHIHDAHFPPDERIHRRIPDFGWAVKQAAAVCGDDNGMVVRAREILERSEKSEEKRNEKSISRNLSGRDR